MGPCPHPLLSHWGQSCPLLHSEPVTSRTWDGFVCLFSHVWLGESSQDKGLLCGSDGKQSACKSGDLDLIPGSARSLGEGSVYSLQHSCLENSMGWGARWAYRPWGCKESDTTEHYYFPFLRTKEGKEVWWVFDWWLIGPGHALPPGKTAAVQLVRDSFAEKGPRASLAAVGRQVGAWAGQPQCPVLLWVGIFRRTLFSEHFKMMFT